MSKKLTRGQKAWVTRKANQLKASKAMHTAIKNMPNGPLNEAPFPFDKSGPVVSDLGSTMVLLEKAIDALTIRINLQTQRIRDMM